MADVKYSIFMPVLLTAMAVVTPLKAQNVAAVEPAVPNVPRQVTPSSVAVAPTDSPDASKIDARDPGHVDSLDAKTLDGAPAAEDSDSQNGIAATVNDQPISDFELRQRMALIAATRMNISLNQLKPEDFKRLRTSTLDQLEDEKIRLQEATKKHITVSPVEVDKMITRLIGENRLTAEQFHAILANAGASEDALKAEFIAQIAWQKAVQDEYGDRINITPSDVEAEMARAIEGANKTHYDAAEIFLPVDNSNQDAKVQKEAQDVEAQLAAGAQFPTLANQLSQSPTAAQGGELGLVYDGQLAPELNAALAAMKVGEISKPVRSVGGYYILMLRGRLEPLGTKITDEPSGPVGPAGTLKLARLLFPVPPTAAKDLVEAAVKTAGQIRSGYAGCAKLAEVAKQIPGAVYFDLGDMKIADLSPDLQKALAATRPGEMAAPMMSDAGIEMIGRCDAKVEQRTVFTLPTREEIQNQLFDQQISALGRRYMRDLKRDADVEVR